MVGSRERRVNARLDELLAWTLARQARPGDVLVVGVATPIATAAAFLARTLLVPDLTILLGTAVNPALADLSEAMLAPERLGRMAEGHFSQLEILDFIHKGEVSLQYISPAQVDGRGRINSSRVRNGDRWVRLPGGLATADIAVLVGRLVAYRADHSPRFLTPAVDFVSGVGADPQWRTEDCLPGRGVEAIVTSRAVLAWTGTGFRVASVHPGHTRHEVLDGCGFPLQADSAPPSTPPPPTEALELCRRVIDPRGLGRLEVRHLRAQALDELTAAHGPGDG
ncbi:MAG: hypothetical protein KatS3mg011_2371 [Acidimicrobiia bacterium]|nr:MAG: hypothetical protein KatS3mg011_2371 [Acidimicrobiia bacterium]